MRAQECMKAGIGRHWLRVIDGLALQLVLPRAALCHHHVRGIDGRDRLVIPVGLHVESIDRNVRVGRKIQRLVADLRAIACVIEDRSEDNTSEIQSLMRKSYAVYCLKNK